MRVFAASACLAASEVTVTTVDIAQQSFGEAGCAGDAGDAGSVKAWALTEDKSCLCEHFLTGADSLSPGMQVTNMYCCNGDMVLQSTYSGHNCEPTGNPLASQNYTVANTQAMLDAECHTSVAMGSTLHLKLATAYPAEAQPCCIAAATECPTTTTTTSTTTLPEGTKQYVYTSAGCTGNSSLSGTITATALSADGRCLCESFVLGDVNPAMPAGTVVSNYYCCENDEVSQAVILGDSCQGTATITNTWTVEIAKAAFSAECFETPASAVAESQFFKAEAAVDAAKLPTCLKETPTTEDEASTAGAPMVGAAVALAGLRWL
mmetsp:Transcript_7954/g.18769  ORF Transcript_7954/g.18769 Transcript_7954/m.18769 type:complete len:321 (+) Transcript_7954:45-1007(+)